MASDLNTELRQNKPFSSLRHEAHVAIIRTSWRLMDAFERALKPFGITVTQFNVLRILRGSNPDGLCRNELADRMVTRMPDMTRLLDRMEDMGLIERSRDPDDRRMVRTQITKKGLKLLEQVDETARAEQDRPFERLDDEEVRMLIEMLQTIRESLQHDQKPG